MKKVLYYVIVMFTFVLLLPFAILATILWLYSILINALVRKLCNYVRNTAKMPKWFGYFANYLYYIADFSV